MSTPPKFTVDLLNGGCIHRPGSGPRILKRSKAPRISLTFSASRRAWGGGSGGRGNGGGSGSGCGGGGGGGGGNRGRDCGEACQGGWGYRGGFTNIEVLFYCPIGVADLHVAEGTILGLVNNLSCTEGMGSSIQQER